MPKLAKKFKFTHACGDYMYTAEEDDNGQYLVTWDWQESDGFIPGTDGRKYDPFTTFDADTVRSNIINAIWIIKEVIIGPEVPDEGPLENGDTVWPFPPLTFTAEDAMFSPAVGFQDAEFVPPDDIPDLVPEGMTLDSVRQFFKDFPHYEFEMNDTYYVVKPVENSYGERSVVWLAKTERELEDCLDAMRRLEQYADRG